jgi:transposase
VRSRLVGQRTAVINQIRSFLLERGIAVRQGPRFLRQRLPEILAKRIDVLSPRMIAIIEDLSGDWRRHLLRHEAEPGGKVASFGKVQDQSLHRSHRACNTRPVHTDRF